VLSGARLAAQTPPYELYTFTTAPPSGRFPPTTISAPRFEPRRLNATASASPGRRAGLLFGLRVGTSFVRAISGATGVLLTTVPERANDRIRNSPHRRAQDLDGDNFKEFIAPARCPTRGAHDSGGGQVLRFSALTRRPTAPAGQNRLVDARLHASATEREVPRAVLDQRD